MGCLCACQHVGVEHCFAGPASADQSGNGERETRRDAAKAGKESTGRSQHRDRHDFSLSSVTIPKVVSEYAVAHVRYVGRVCTR